MKKWLYIFTFLIIAVIWQSVRLYTLSFAEEDQLRQQAITRVKEQTDLDKAVFVDFYHGTMAYHVVTGTTKSGESVIAWVPDSKASQDIIVKSADEGLTKQEVKAIIQSERTPQQIKSIKLGMEENIPLWQVTYIDKNNRLTYYYLEFETGAFIKRYSLKKNTYREDS